MMNYVKKVRQKVGNMPLVLAVTGTIVYKDDKILLQYRTDHNLWAIHGGAIELGETVEMAMKRELMEEINIVPTKYRLYGIYSGPDMHNIYPNGDEVYYVNIVYFCEEYDGDIKVDHDEVEKLKWFDVNSLPDDMMTVDRVILKDLNKFLTKC